jgi:hypothetical protein
LADRPVNAAHIEEILQKLANHRFSEACCEVGAELEHIWQQFQLDISTKSLMTKHISKLSDEKRKSSPTKLAGSNL